MPEPAEQPAKHGRSLVGFYMAIGVLAALVGMGAWLYEPLKLRYAIHVVKRDAPTNRHDFHGDTATYLRWLGHCMSAARQGNTSAMEAVIAASSFGDYWDWAATGISAYDPVYQVSASQPKIFFEVLDRQPDYLVRRCIENITISCDSHSLGDPTDMISDSISPYAATLERIVEHRDGEIRNVTQSALEFTRRRFARELAEAEKSGAKECLP